MGHNFCEVQHKRQFYFNKSFIITRNIYLISKRCQNSLLMTQGFIGRIKLIYLLFIYLFATDLLSIYTITKSMRAL